MRNELSKSPESTGKITTIESRRRIDCTSGPDILKVLVMCHIPVVAILKNTGNSVSLEVLISVGWHNLTILPNTSVVLMNLKKLDICDVKLQEPPVNFGNLTTLEYLRVRSTNLGKLPESCENLINLLYLDSKFNKINCLFGAELLVKLEALKLHENRNLESLSENFVKLVKLRLLDVKNSKTSNLPDGIGNLKKLTFLRNRKSR